MIITQTTIVRIQLCASVNMIVNVYALCMETFYYNHVTIASLCIYFGNIYIIYIYYASKLQQLIQSNMFLKSCGSLLTSLLFSIKTDG